MLLEISLLSASKTALTSFRARPVSCAMELSTSLFEGALPPLLFPAVAAFAIVQSPPCEVIREMTTPKVVRTRPSVERDDYKQNCGNCNPESQKMPRIRGI